MEEETAPHTPRSESPNENSMHDAPGDAALSVHEGGSQGALPLTKEGQRRGVTACVTVSCVLGGGDLLLHTTAHVYEA